MFRNIPVCGYIFIVCGVVLAVQITKSNAQYSLYGYGRQSSSPLQSGYPGYGFGQGSSYSYHGVTRNTVTLPDGTTRTEEIFRNSDGTPQGTTIEGGTYGNYPSSSIPASYHPGTYPSNTGFEEYPTGSLGGTGHYTPNSNDEEECVLPPPQRYGDYFLPNEQSLSPGSGVPSGWQMRYTCADGTIVLSLCLRGSWRPSLPKCKEPGSGSSNNAGGGCNRPPSVENGRYSLENLENLESLTRDSPVPYGTRIEYSCDQGYSLSSVPDTFTCTRFSGWFPKMPLPDCVANEECYRGSDCPRGKACIANRCLYPCQHPCDSNAVCKKMKNGRYSCVCKNGFVSDSDGVCKPKAKQECTQDSDCPRGKACITNKCLDPCQGSCGSNASCRKVQDDRYSCVCKTGFVSDTVGDCKPKDPPECRVNIQCSDKLVCLKEKCVDPCVGLCGNNTICSVKDHHADCACKPGHTGNAFVGCQPQLELCPALRIQNVDVRCMFQDKEVACDSTIKPDTIATSQCKENYKLAYQPEYTQLTCLHTGHWDYPLVPCIPDEKFCPPLKFQELNLNVKCIFQSNDVSCDSPMKPGTIVTSHCKQFYQTPPRQVHSQLTCLSSGDWSNTLSRCNPVCGRSTEIGHELPVPLIVDGKEAKVGSFPWHAGIYFRQQQNGTEVWEQRCGGSLISDQFILTAAHCVYDQEEKDLHIAMGKYYRSWDRSENSEQKRNVMKILYPPEFYKQALDFDIALLVLEEKIEVGEFVMPVCSRASDVSMDVIRNEKFYAVGWGRTREGESDSLSETLQYNDVKFVPEQECHRLIPPLASLIDRFCTLKNNGSDVSIVQPGDSGGGLTMVFDGLHYIFGIVSNKIKQVSVFTNVTSVTHITWIENQIRPYESNFRWRDH